jgi:very-short-patch-repair endonuclease
VRRSQAAGHRQLVRRAADYVCVDNVELEVGRRDERLERRFDKRGGQPDGKRYRVDFAWPQFRVVLEADGRGKYRGDELWGEKQRALALTRAGYRVVRVVWKDVLATWPATSAWLSDLLPTDRSR